MAYLSKFNVFQAGTNGAPYLYGTSGSLLAVLDFCLVSGSGWTNPHPHSTTITGSTIVLGCYQQPTGSGCVLFINDGNPHGVTTYKEAWATGWEVLTSMTSSAVSASFSGSTTASVGFGYGQLPYVGQLATTNINGHITVVKSATLDRVTQRPWIMYADSSSFYLFILSGTTAGTYQSLFFGDIFSYKPDTDGVDNYKCMIQGRLSDNDPTTVGNDQNDTLTVVRLSFTAMAQGASGFMQRNMSGRTPSLWFSKLGDYGKCISATPNTTAQQSGMFGLVPLPTLNNALFMSPVEIWEPNGGIRGKMRGMYHIGHPIANFHDGQIFNGSNDYDGKTFQIIKKGFNSGMWCIEISNTVDTN